ncbi:MAG: 6-bladed beta-propeller [Treponema sp.]|nr:6-bladed beta-propeller [Treponema sp.]
MIGRNYREPHELLLCNMSVMRHAVKIICVLLWLILFFNFNVFAQEGTERPGPVTGGTGTAALSAADEFRLGVHAYNRFAYNEAILSFERALSFRPGQPMILDWLGKAYYRSGFEEIAVRQWRAALEGYGRNTGTGILLGSRIETVANRRFLFPVADDNVRYVESGRFPGKLGDITLYRQPTSVLANNDGSMWVVAYGSNEMLRIDVNGIIRERKRGPLNGFDRPYDLVRGLDGRMYLSEFRGGRVSILSENGDWLAYAGSRGLGAGQLIGPQHLTVDEDGYLYVVDYGNRRICKFDPDGVFINSFGLRSSVFPGLLSPAGIAAKEGKIYIADGSARAVYMFDPNGNYLGRLALVNLTGPESLRFLSDGTLLIADGNRILQIDTDSAIIRELGLSGRGNTRITCADMDKNGSIITSNFDASEISVMTRSDTIASGLFVQIRNINADRFPQITVELTVEDRLRRPIQGLDSSNFLLSEGGIPVDRQNLAASGFRHSGADISLLVERSNETARLRDDLTAASRDISGALQGMDNSRIVSVVSAAAQPRREQHSNSLENAVRGSADSNTPRWRFDLGLRLAATDLLPGAPRRSIVYIGSGSLGELAFEQYSLVEMACYLANNGIVFNAVIIGSGQITDAVDYLCRQTGGQAMYLYRPRGIRELIRSTAQAPSGLYSFTYNSRLQTDFGRAWLPFEAEVYLLERSGRDNTGYFPPLE